jgi:hypothetical protein
VQRHGREPEAERATVIDHAGTLLSLTSGWGRVSPDARTQILREAAEYIVALRQQLELGRTRRAQFVRFKQCGFDQLRRRLGLL